MVRKTLGNAAAAPVISAQEAGAKIEEHGRMADHHSLAQKHVAAVGQQEAAQETGVEHAVGVQQHPHSDWQGPTSRSRSSDTARPSGCGGESSTS